MHDACLFDALTRVSMRAYCSHEWRSDLCVCVEQLHHSLGVPRATRRGQVLIMLLLYLLHVLQAIDGRLGSNTHQHLTPIQMLNFFFFTLSFVLSLTLVDARATVPTASTSNDVRLNSTSNTHFVYAYAPAALISRARAAGTAERLAYVKALATVPENDEDERMHLYSHHMLKCGEFGADEQWRVDLANENDESSDSDQFSSGHSRRAARRALELVGFDAQLAKLVTQRSASTIDTTLTSICRSNELQLQCALAFVDYDDAKIRAHVAEMSKTDGAFKLLADEACSQPPEASNSPSPIASFYSCVGASAGEVHRACAAPLAVYSQTRTRVNTRIHRTYQQALERVASALERQTSAEAENELVSARRKLHASLLEIRSMEATRCRLYASAERCATQTLVDTCGKTARPRLATLLKVGALRRERGDVLHAQLAAHEMPPHASCASSSLDNTVTNDA